jgi:hypothetical protein
LNQFTADALQIPVVAGPRHEHGGAWHAWAVGQGLRPFSETAVAGRGR